MRITRDTTDRLTVGIGQLLRVGRQLSHRAAHELYGDLPSYGWAVLVPLESGGEQRLSALALQLGVDGSVASRQVAVLERSGLITRRPDPQDGRASLLGLSEAGRAVLAHTRSAIERGRAAREAWQVAVDAWELAHPVAAAERQRDHRPHGMIGKSWVPIVSAAFCVNPPS